MVGLHVDGSAIRGDHRGTSMVQVRFLQEGRLQALGT